MKKKIKLWLSIVTLLVFDYLALSLLQKTFNPLSWSDGLRFAICLAIILASAFALAFGIAKHNNLN